MPSSFEQERLSLAATYTPEQYARLRVTELLGPGAGGIKPGSGGWAAIWRRLSTDAVTQAHNAGFNDAGFYLRMFGHPQASGGLAGAQGAAYGPQPSLGLSQAQGASYNPVEHPVVNALLGVLRPPGGVLPSGGIGHIAY